MEVFDASANQIYTQPAYVDPIHEDPIYVDPIYTQPAANSVLTAPATEQIYPIDDVDEPLDVEEDFFLDFE